MKFQRFKLAQTKDVALSALHSVTWTEDADLTSFQANPRPLLFGSFKDNRFRVQAPRNWFWDSYVLQKPDYYFEGSIYETSGCVFLEGRFTLSGPDQFRYFMFSFLLFLFGLLITGIIINMYFVDQRSWKVLVGALPGIGMCATAFYIMGAFRTPTKIKKYIFGVFARIYPNAQHVGSSFAPGPVIRRNGGNSA
tara:strand:+ start:51 stop:632 length:582 start_codon:yes stop_codon:yes gene_type:complete